ncbi:metal ABC transporter substrate-binding protein [Haloferula sargassicola]|uniref:Manganese-binding lipoprotein MntA n=1 Tax=Haloferula sargassicola TaxID=490096 RepID=A0ABP9UJX1_9BACT
MPRWFLPFLLSCLAAHGDLKVAALHPLLAELAQQVGGDQVEVIDLMGPNGDPHHFEPTPRQLRETGRFDLMLACGLGLESGLSDIRDLLPAGSEMVEVGEALPTLAGTCDDPSHHHDHDGRDPHWWHSVETYRRAVSVVESAFSRLDPDQADAYATRADSYRQQLDRLDRWVRRQVARVPRDRRVLATSHAAFGYFCHEFGFRAVAVQGLTREQMPDAASLARVFTELRDQHVTVIFPEKGANPAILRALVKDGHLRLGPQLDADGTRSASYEAMIRGNVTAIRDALAR